MRRHERQERRQERRGDRRLGTRRSEAIHYKMCQELVTIGEDFFIEDGHGQKIY